MEYKGKSTGLGADARPTNVAEHTSGPWGWSVTGEKMADGYSQPFGVYEVGKANLVAGCFGDVAGGIEVAKANARLIAAAPEMRECIKLLRQIIIDGALEGFNPLVGDWAERLYASQARTHAVIRQIEGRS